MATKLFLRATQANGIGATYFDMLPVEGPGFVLATVNTVPSGAENQWTQTAGGTVIQWLSGRVPAGGFTLTTSDISVVVREPNSNANCGGRFRVFKRAADGTETELGGGPFDEGVEFGTTFTTRAWTGNVTDTAFAENDRILLKLYITPAGGTWGATVRIAELRYDQDTGGSFFNIAETVAFKAEGPEEKAASDTLAGGVTETIALLGRADAVETLTTGVTEAVELGVVLAAADSLGPALVETVTERQALLAPADSLEGVLDESTAILVSLVPADTVAPTLAETASVAVLVEVADSVAVAVSETSAVEQAEAKGVSDSLGPSLVETATILVTLDINDTVAPGISETSILLIALAASDTLTPALAEAGVLEQFSALATLAASDSLDVGIGESAEALPQLPIPFIYPITQRRKPKKNPFLAQFGTRY